MGYIGQVPTAIPLTSADIADGTIALADMSSQSVDEDNLHISNAGSNGQFLSKQSGDAGGLTWAAAGGGDVRNFIIDGDFTQWPEGTTNTGVANGDYPSALIVVNTQNCDQLVIDGKRSTDVPTVAQSGHQSGMNIKIDVLTEQP
jgi:hypothetical protein